MCIRDRVSSTLPLAVPRCDDCIGVLLGAKKRYRAYFDSREGIYWYSPGWIDFGDVPCEEYYQRRYEHYRAPVSYTHLDVYKRPGRS